jgi:TRAP-type C4-dicarboxylate transport system substrate-binding protein
MLGAPSARRARAEAPAVLRIATLAPEGSAWMLAFNAWSVALEERTEGRLRLHFFSGGSAGDERDAVRKMRAGQLDAAAVTTVGLGQIVRSCLVLQAPGVCHSYARLDAVRRELGAELDAQFEAAGFKRLGWEDAGQTRLFSNRPILVPSDMRQTRMWAWRDDPTWQAVLAAAEVNGVPLGLPEVYPALRTERIDAFPGTALAAVAFQWFTKAAYVTQEPRGILVGALVLKKERFDALEPALQAALLETSEQAHQSLAPAIQRDDQRAFDAIVERGVKATSLAANLGLWEETLGKARRALAGKLYPAELLERVERVAAKAG